VLSGGATRTPEQASLYRRLGGKPAAGAVIDEFVANVAADRRIDHFFAQGNIPWLKGLLVDRACQASGGPCTDTGRDMKNVHKGMGITAADFAALVEDLVKALDRFKVPAKEKQELLSMLAPMKGDIVLG
jgi:hemoglobin